MQKFTDIKFPKGLLFWAGHRDGGVKKPFIESSGRPTGEIIRTNLLDKLDSWIDLLVRKDISAPRALLMIGGPGNGKTEALEYFVEKLDESLNAEGTLTSKCNSMFNPSAGLLSPRKVTIDLNSILGSELRYNQLELVYDATVGDLTNPTFSPEELLINDLNNVNNDDNLLHISCINRGILSQTLDIVSLSAENEIIKDILVDILRVVTISPEQPSCWGGVKYIV